MKGWVAVAICVMGARNGASQVAASSAAKTPSVVLQPALAELRQAVAEVEIDRWKVAAEVRSEAETNVHSIERDVESTLPALLTAADASPDATAKALPVYRNVGALYDVLLRVDAAERLGAPAAQVSALDQALVQLNDAERTLGDQIQQNADVEAAQTMRLQAALQAVPAPAAVPAPVACAPPPVVKKKKAKPAATAGAAESTTTH